MNLLNSHILKKLITNYNRCIIVKNMSKDKNKSNQKVSNQILEGKKIQKKSPFWFYIVLISIPFVFVILLEILLRYFNYGYDFKYFTQASEYYPNKYFANPDLPRKYFSILKLRRLLCLMDLILKRKAMRLEFCFGRKQCCWLALCSQRFISATHKKKT